MPRGYENRWTSTHYELGDPGTSFTWLGKDARDERGRPLRRSVRLAEMTIHGESGTCLWGSAIRGSALEATQLVEAFGERAGKKRKKTKIDGQLTTVVEREAAHDLDNASKDAFYNNLSKLLKVPPQHREIHHVDDMRSRDDSVFYIGTGGVNPVRVYYKIVEVEYNGERRLAAILVAKATKDNQFEVHNALTCGNANRGKLKK